MKHCVLFSVLSSVFTQSSAGNSRLLLQQQGIINRRPTCSCTRELNPVCCDNESFDNACLAECNGIVVEDQCVTGACDINTADPCICTLEYDPVCCNAIEYDNLCNAECAGFTQQQCDSGECSSFPFSSTLEADTFATDCLCTLEYDPVCCDSITFANPCAAVCAEEDECVPGECTSDDCLCTTDYNPVCCDGLDYSNECGAECDGHDINDPNTCLIGDCSSNLCACTFESNPICCNDNQYANSCVAECDGVTAPARNQPECSIGGCATDCVCTFEYAPLCCNGADFSNACNAECDGINTAECTDGTCCDVEFPDYAPVCCRGVEYNNRDRAHCYGFNTESCVEGPCATMVYCRDDTECDEGYECGVNPYSANICPLQNDAGCDLVCMQRGEICGSIVGQQLCEADETCFAITGSVLSDSGFCGRIQLQQQRN